METETWPTGVHLGEFEPPDIFHARIRGPVSLADARESLRLTLDELGKKRGIRVFFVAHLEVDVPGGPFTSEARAYLEREGPDWKAIIVVGGNAVSRLAASIVGLAHSLLSPGKMPMKMVKSEEEARKYIVELRAKEEAQPAA